MDDQTGVHVLVWGFRQLSSLLSVEVGVPHSRADLRLDRCRAWEARVTSGPCIPGPHSLLASSESRPS